MYVCLCVYVSLCARLRFPLWGIIAMAFRMFMFHFGRLCVSLSSWLFVFLCLYLTVSVSACLYLVLFYCVCLFVSLSYCVCICVSLSYRVCLCMSLSYCSVIHAQSLS